ncbi:MAG: hypothetical protein FJ109_08965 [Deltaproteobacteria bacterium]|nr:hypothetical protein [Deltaproteobacteria bacterium]
MLNIVVLSDDQTWPIWPASTGLWNCIEECPAGGDSSCFGLCYFSSTTEAQQTWDDFIDCLELGGYFECPEGDDPCLDQAWEACGAEFAACIECTPSCVGKECGDDGCGGTCGTCPEGKACNQWGKLVGLLQ